VSDSYNFCSAMLCISASYAVMRCVCVSVCLSRLWIVSKRINIASKFFHHSIFYHAKWHSSIPTGTPPPNGDVKCRWVGRNRDSEPISGLTACVNAATGRCCKCGRRWSTASVLQVMTSLVVSGGFDCRRR